MDSLLYIIPILALAWAIIWAFFSFFYPRWENYYKLRPKLVITLKPAENLPSQIQSPLGMSAKNGPISQGPDEDWYCYEFLWNFDLEIINNSDLNAFKITLLQNKKKPRVEFREKIDFNRALLAHKEISLPFRITLFVEIQGKERENFFNSTPPVLKVLNVVLEYENSKGRKFYSTFNFDTRTTTYKRYTKNDINENWIKS